MTPPTQTASQSSLRRGRASVFRMAGRMGCGRFQLLLHGCSWPPRAWPRCYTPPRRGRNRQNALVVRERGEIAQVHHGGESVNRRMLGVHAGAAVFEPFANSRPAIGVDADDDASRVVAPLRDGLTKQEIQLREITRIRILRPGW